MGCIDEEDAELRFPFFSCAETLEDETQEEFISTFSGLQRFQQASSADSLRVTKFSVRKPNEKRCVPQPGAPTSLPLITLCSCIMTAPLEHSSHN
ncbi:hypothetical protein ATANTOWER_007817 [Ataeniobius toweri]|uniref:Uncharacterized protein n=1 Tax=Ataeniobius toweri TaxID=208326 RepID=A0ABU7AQ49_9TELE|nr:hypothetical protein [Ataeniobius toweri]